MNIQIPPPDAACIREHVRRAVLIALEGGSETVEASHLFSAWDELCAQAGELSGVRGAAVDDEWRSRGVGRGSP